ncbi:hypothetical protein BC831DRAFT_497246 [Entophlyctis helioformis]|nr:hypothetical protein BC831DRAFT_497246 [Entophlyctis helioformis]
MRLPSTRHSYCVLQYEAFQSAVEATFWQTLSTNKINVYKLDDATVPVQGYYTSGDTFISAASISLPARLCVNATSFSKLKRLPTPQTINTNTIEDFKAVDKTSLLKTTALEIWQDILSGAAEQEPSLLGRFLLLTFADLKKYRFYYWFAFPAILPSEPILLRSPAKSVVDAYGQATVDALRVEYDRFRGTSSSPGFFLLKVSGEKVQMADLSAFHQFFGSADASSITVGFVDPSGLAENPGWPLRNLLALVATRWRLSRVKSLRRQRDISASLVLDVSLASYPDEPKCVGWEKGIQGKLSPRVADLAPLMDPTRFVRRTVLLDCCQSPDLMPVDVQAGRDGSGSHLKLMRWRILPELKLERVSQTKCLLLGAGTLGCYVGRVLLAWGVRHITFVDNGKVSFSNPVRQPLFKFKDCLTTATGVDMSIPMPGHNIHSSDATKKDIKKLEDLVQSHDAVFLLTDSRESRWLPTLLGAAMGKIVINAALGFDTFVVMRHGMRVPNTDAQSLPAVQDLGCYFCNDVVAPTDSLSERTLDQQCTVTRPGLAAIASALAVELLSSVLNHPQGPWAPAANQPNETGSSVLGAMPHQIRGYLGQFNNLLVVGQAYDKCPACSRRVLDEYAKSGHSFVVKGLESPKYLEELSGLAELQQQGNDLDVDWEGDEDADF